MFPHSNIVVVYSLVTHIKRYAMAINKTVKNIVTSRRRMADQLRCRVPAPLANRLLAGEDLSSDYFNCVSVLVCQPADVHRLPSRYSADVIGQVVRGLRSTLRQAALNRDAYVLYYGGGKFVVVSGESNCQNLIRSIRRFTRLHNHEAARQFLLKYVLVSTAECKTPRFYTRVYTL